MDECANTGLLQIFLQSITSRMPEHKLVPNRFGARVPRSARLDRDIRSGPPGIVALLYCDARSSHRGVGVLLGGSSPEGGQALN